MTKTHLMHADRIERLILALTIALFWPVSTGMHPDVRPSAHTKKLYLSMTSFFMAGVRFLLHAALSLATTPHLWACVNYVGW